MARPKKEIIKKTFSDISELVNFDNKFKEKFSELNNRIYQNELALQELKSEYNRALMSYLENESEENSALLNSLKGKELFLINQLAENKALLNKLQEMKNNSMLDKVLTAKANLNEGYKALKVAEKSHFDTYYKLQEQALKELLAIVKLRDRYSNEVIQYNLILENNELTQYKNHYNPIHEGNCNSDCGSGTKIPVNLPLHNLASIKQQGIRGNTGHMYYSDLITESFKNE